MTEPPNINYRLTGIGVKEDRDEVRNLRLLIAAIAIMKPGLIIPDHVMDSVDYRKVRIYRSELKRGYYIYYEESK